jgi:hypothetical protein
MADWMTWDGGALTADIVTDISAEHTSEVTEHPVEDGSTISDHVNAAPPTVAFEFAQSAMSLRDEDLKWQQAPINVRESQFQPQGLLMLTMAAGAAVSALTNAIGLTSAEGELKTWTLTAKTNKDRIHEMHDALVAVWTSAKKVTFNYQGLVLSDYISTAVKYQRKNKEGGLCRFAIEAKHIETVKTASSSLIPSGLSAGTTVLRALPVASKGPQNAEGVEKAVVEKSMLASGLDSLAGKVGL